MLVFSLVLAFLGLVSCNHVPAVIWGRYGGLDQTLKPQGLKILENEFASLIRSLTANRPHILLFLEQNLSVEDLNGDSYPNLKNISRTDGKSKTLILFFKSIKSFETDFLYLNSVETPISALHQLTDHGYAFAKFDEDAPPTLANPAILTVSLREPRADEPRQSFLRAHDEDMARISEEAVRQYGRVLALYTGRHASFVTAFPRSKREGLSR